MCSRRKASLAASAGAWTAGAHGCWPPPGVSAGQRGRASAARGSGSRPSPFCQTYWLAARQASLARGRRLQVVAAGPRGRPGVALAVDHIDLASVRTHGDGGGIPAGGDQADDSRRRRPRGAPAVVVIVAVSIVIMSPPGDRARPVARSLRRTTARAFSPPLVTSRVRPSGASASAVRSGSAEPPCRPRPAVRRWRWSRAPGRAAVSITATPSVLSRAANSRSAAPFSRATGWPPVGMRAPTRRPRRRSRQGDDLAVTLAGDIGARRWTSRPPRGDRSRRLAPLGRIDDARAQVLFDDGAGGEVDQADRVVLDVGDQQAATVRTDRDAGGLRLGESARGLPCGRGETSWPRQSPAGPCTNSRIASSTPPET